MQPHGSKVCVIGGAGFIGLHVVRELARREAQVRIVDDLRHGEEQRCAAEQTGAEIIPRNSADLVPVENSIAGCDLVIDLATAAVREPLTLLAPRRVGMIDAAVPLACAIAKIQRYLYVSSSAVYGEATNGPLHEQSICHPQTAYGVAKLAGEGYARAVSLAYKLEVAIVRPFNVYGPGCHVDDRADEAIPRWIVQAARGVPLTIHGDGAQTRDYAHVVDIARGIVDAAMTDAAANTRPINLCSGVERSVIEIAREIAASAEIQRGEGHPCDIRRQVGSFARAATILGWSPRIGWREGIEQTRADVLARIGCA